MSGTREGRDRGSDSLIIINFYDAYIVKNLSSGGLRWQEVGGWS